MEHAVRIIRSLALAAGLVLCGQAGAVPPGALAPGVPVGGPVDANTLAGRLNSDRATDVFNVMDAAYGAKCDGVTDDATAINLAMTAARAVAVTGNLQQILIESPAARTCLIKSSINATGFRTRGVSIALRLMCQTGHHSPSSAYTPCIDGYGSQYIDWTGTKITTTATSYPDIGLMIGTPDGSGAGGMNIAGLDIAGYFTLTPFYNQGSEDMTGEAPRFRNVYTGSVNYGAILDAYNHWGITSQFVTVSRAIDSAISMNSTLLKGPSFYTAGQVGSGANVSAPLWAGGLAMLRIERGYADAITTPLYGMVLFSEGASTTPHIDVDMHFEHTPNLASAFYVTGTYASPVFNGFRHQDHNGMEAASVFATDASVITSVAMNDLELDITGFSAGAVPLFDQPTLYSINGFRVTLPNIASWTEPGVGGGGGASNGEACFASSTVAGTCYNYRPTETINRNPDFLVSQVLGGSGATLIAGQPVIDGWRYQGGGSGLVLQFQQSTLSPSLNASYSLSTKVITTGTFTTSQQARVESFVEGPDILTANMGTSSAVGFTIDFWSYATLAGQYSFYFQNSGRSRSYVSPITITVANTWQHFVIRVPGETSGTWLTTLGTAGLRFGLSYGGGSAANAPSSNAWQSAAYYNTATDANFAGAVNNQIYLSAFRVYVGQASLPYRRRPFDRELDISRRWYQKSCDYAVVCKQVAALGAVGAVTMRTTLAGVSTSGPDRSVQFSPPMAGVPSVILASTSLASGNCYDVTTAADAGTAVTGNLGTKGFDLQCGQVAATAIGDLLQAQWIADLAL